MIKEGKFGVHEAVCLLTIAICNKIFFTAPGYVTRTVGTASWYMTLISCASAIVVFTFTYLLLKRFPGRDIIEIFDASLGRAAGFVFSFIMMASFLVASGFLTREFADVIKIYNYPTTPMGVLIGAMLIIVMISAFLGLETIARVAKLSAYFALFGYLLLLVLAAQYFKPAHLFPILGYGLGKTITTGIIRNTAYAEVLILVVFAGSFQGIAHIKKAGYISLALSGVLLSLGLVCYSMVFEYTSTQEITAPIYVMVRLIKFGDFLQRMDPMFLFLWIITSIIYVSILFYAAVSIYCKMFRLQDTRPVIFPMAVLAFVIAIIPRDFSGDLMRYIQGLRLYGNITFFALPVTALITAALRKKKGEKLE